jgi:hypothetical protein
MQYTKWLPLLSKMMEGRNEGNGAINCALFQQIMQTFIQQFWQCTKCNACHLIQIIFKQYGHCASYTFKCFTSLFGLHSVSKTFTFLCATLYTSNCIYCYVCCLPRHHTIHIERGSGRKT